MQRLTIVQCAVESWQKMKTKELINILQKEFSDNWLFKSAHGDTAISCDFKMDDSSKLQFIVYSTVITYDESIQFTARALEALSQYLDTPLEERKEEKKYNIILFQDKDDYDDEPYYTALYHDTAMRIMSDDRVDCDDLSTPQYQFTHLEIDTLCEDKPEYATVIIAGMREVKE